MLPQYSGNSDCLPDKEFRYLRTIIVIADVHWRFEDWLAPLLLTFQHWSGVTLYTSPCGFAESCVFGKQSLGKLSLRPAVDSVCEQTTADSIHQPAFIAPVLFERSFSTISIWFHSICFCIYKYPLTWLSSSWSLLTCIMFLETSSQIIRFANISFLGKRILNHINAIHTFIF